MRIVKEKEKIDSSCDSLVKLAKLINNKKNVKK